MTDDAKPDQKMCILACSSISLAKSVSKCDEPFYQNREPFFNENGFFHQFHYLNRSGRYTRIVISLCGCNAPTDLANEIDEKRLFFEKGLTILVEGLITFIPVLQRGNPFS